MVKRSGKGNRQKGRGVSVATVVMLCLTLAVLLGGGAMVLKLRNSSVSFAAVDSAGGVAGKWSLKEQEETPGAETPVPEQTSEAALLLVPVQTPGPTETPAPKTVTITFGGTFALQSEVRQSCFYAATKGYDFSELFTLISSRLKGDLCAVTLENLTAGSKYTDLLAPSSVMSGLKTNGIGMVNLGFPKCMDKGLSVLQSTVQDARSAGLLVRGAFQQQEDASVQAQLVELQGRKIAILHYTDSLSAQNRKKLQNGSKQWAVPQSSMAADDIRKARELGADVVIVSMSWGKQGAKTPTTAQKTLAQQLCEAGADVIVGAGSRAVQTAEYLTAKSGRRTLCCYSLGTLMSESRTDEGVTGILLHLTFSTGANGVLTLTDAAYTPTYTWHYKQDSVWHFRIVNAGSEAPDGMDSSQENSLLSARKRVVARLGADTPLRAGYVER